MTHQLLLVVDDDKRLRSFVTSVFSAGRLRVLEGATGQDALDLTHGLVPDLILLDLHMPRMDGLKACDHLRERPELAHTPIIVLSEDRDAATVAAAYAAGADDFIAKPFTLAVLEEKVEHWLRHPRQAALAEPS